MLLAAGSGDSTIRIWETETGKMVEVLNRHRGAVTSLAYSPDGSRLASCSLDRYLTSGAQDHLLVQLTIGFRVKTRLRLLAV